MISLGVTAVECKSGYGLRLDDELKLLRAYKRLGESTPARIVPTFLVRTPCHRNSRITGPAIFA